MTGRDLIILIMSNHLEDEEVFKDGKLIGFMDEKEAAVELEVGVKTVIAMWLLGRLPGFELGDHLYFPKDIKIEQQMNFE